MPRVQIAFGSVLVCYLEGGLTEVLISMPSWRSRIQRRDRLLRLTLSICK